VTCRSLVVAALVLVVAAPALAGEPTDRLRTLFERANDVLLASDADGRGPDDRLVAVRALVADVFDFDGAASLAMGRHWDPMPPSARRAFTRLYADVVERGYLAWVAAKARIGEGGVSVRWLGEQIQGNAATVSSVLLARTGAELPIEYRLIRGKSGWLVRDVVVDGVSLAANYHVQVERVMQQGSYEELLARLQDKAGPAARAAAAASPPSCVSGPTTSEATCGGAYRLCRSSRRRSSRPSWLRRRARRLRRRPHRRRWRPHRRRQRPRRP